MTRAERIAAPCPDIAASALTITAQNVSGCLPSFRQNYTAVGCSMLTLKADRTANAVPASPPR